MPTRVVVAAFRLGTFANALGNVRWDRRAASEQLIAKFAGTAWDSLDDPQRELSKEDGDLIDAQSFVIEHVGGLGRTSARLLPRASAGLNSQVQVEVTGARASGKCEAGHQLQVLQVRCTK